MEKSKPLIALGAIFAGILLISTLNSQGTSQNTALGAVGWESAVRVEWYYTEDGKELYCSGGSGTLVRDTKTVLTAAHVITQDEEDTRTCPGAVLWVGYPVEARGMRFVWWKASISAQDDVLDVALLDVDLNNEPDGAHDASEAIALIRGGSWPVRSIAANDAGPSIGDPLHILSYPAIGSWTLTYTEGSAAGWSEIDDTEGSGKKFEYLKLDLTVAAGSSGSGVLNARGELVGVVIRGGADWESEVVDCRFNVADTNGDGEVDDRDSCVPIGGFINAALSLYDVRTFLGNHGVPVDPAD